MAEIHVTGEMTREAHGTRLNRLAVNEGLRVERRTTSDGRMQTRLVREGEPRHGEPMTGWETPGETMKRLSGSSWRRKPSAGRARVGDPENPYRLSDLHELDRRLGEHWQQITRGGHQPTARQIAAHRALAAKRRHVSETLSHQRVGGTMGTFRRAPAKAKSADPVRGGPFGTGWPGGFSVGDRVTLKDDPRWRGTVTDAWEARDYRVVPVRWDVDPDEPRDTRIRGDTPWQKLTKLGRARRRVVSPYHTHRAPPYSHPAVRRHRRR